MTTQKGSANLTVKVYVNPDTDQQEIRRIVFDNQLPLNYYNLEGKIMQVFPYLIGRRIKLSWKGKFNIICVVTRLKS